MRKADRLSYDYTKATFDEGFESMLFSMRSSLKQKWWGKTDEYVEDFIDGIKELIVQSILSSPPPSLAPSTIRRKTRLGAEAPEQTWLEGGFTAQNAFADVEIEEGEQRKYVSLSFNEDEHERLDGNNSSGMTVAGLIHTLEFGLGGAPPRPVIAPVIDAVFHGDSPIYDKFSRNMLRIMERSLLWEDE